VRAALLQVLGHVEGGIGPELAAAALRRGAPEERRAVLRWLAGQEAPPKELLPDLVHIVTQDPDGGARAGALAVLTRMRHLPALDLAARAIRSHDRLEAAQGTRTALVLGGSGMRAAIEREFASLPVPNQTAVLEQFRGPMSSEFAASCLELAADRRQGRPLRAAAALALAQAEVTAVAPVLRALFLDDAPFEELAGIARALAKVEAAAPELARLHRGSRPDELALDSERVAALLAAGHPEIAPFCCSQLQRVDLDPALAQSVLRAIRRALLPEIAEAALPAPLDALLR
jgi:hypothetical protein